MDDGRDVWRPLEGFPGYEATIDGRCRSWRRAAPGGGLADAPRELRGADKSIRSRSGRAFHYRSFCVKDASGRVRNLTARQVVVRAFGAAAAPPKGHRWHPPEPRESVA